MTEDELTLWLQQKVTPEDPKLLAPAHQSTGVPLQTTLSWRVLGAVSADVAFGTSSSPPYIATVTESTYTPTGLLPNTTYYWRIRGRNPAGTDQGDVWRFRTGGTAPPGPPGAVTDLRVHSVTASSITLRWTAVPDGAGGVAKYDLRRGQPWANGASVSPAPVGGAAGSTLQYTVSGLPAGTKQDFQLIAYRGTLNVDAVFGPLSNVVSGSTTAAPGQLKITCPPAQTKPNPVTYPPATLSDGVPPYQPIQYTHPSGSTFPIGTTPVGVTGRDSAGGVVNCSFNVTVPDPDPPDPTPPLIFDSRWLTALGQSDAAIRDGTRWDAYGGMPYGEVVADGVGGSNSIQSIFPPNAAFLPNGPNFKIEKLSSFGATQSNLYFAWYVKHVPGWVFGSEEHKMVILYGDNPAVPTEQPFYISADGNGRLFFYNRIADSNFLTTAAFNIGSFDLVEVHVRSGVNGMIEAKLNSVPITLTSSPGSFNPLNCPMGNPYKGFKYDSTYNDYQAVINHGSTIYRRVCAFRVSTAGWIGPL